MSNTVKDTRSQQAINQEKREERLSNRRPVTRRGGPGRIVLAHVTAVNIENLDEWAELYEMGQNW